MGTNFGARDPEVEEPVFGAKSILFEFEVDEVAESKALLPEDLRTLVLKHKSYVNVAENIGASKAFVRQNMKKSQISYSTISSSLSTINLFKLL